MISIQQMESAHNWTGQYGNHLIYPIHKEVIRQLSLIAPRSNAGENQWKNKRITGNHANAERTIQVGYWWSKQQTNSDNTTIWKNDPIRINDLINEEEISDDYQ